MSVFCCCPILECVYCLGCARWAWKKCLYTAGRESENWGHATATEFEPVPRICRYILAVYEYDIRNPLWAPPGGYGIDPDQVVLKKDYDENQGNVSPYMIYIDKDNREILLLISGLNLAKESDYFFVFVWQFCNEFTVPKDKLDHFKRVTAQDIICSQKSGGASLREEDLAVSNVKIDFTKGRNNPLESINFFEDYDSKEKFPISKDQISHLLPAYNQDLIVRVYSKKPDLVNVVSEAFENFQLKTYGMKAQVHGTPERKRSRIFL